MKLYVGNLPFSADEDGLKKLFSEYSPKEVTLIKDKFSGRSKGFGFVTIEDDEMAQKAVSELDGKDFEGRALKISEAKPMEDRPKRDFQRRSFGGGRGGSRGGFGGGRGGGFGGRRDNRREDY